VTGESDVREEAERQLAHAAARHREVVAAVSQSGRSPAGDSSAAAAVTRGAALVTYALRRAVAAGIEADRLAIVSGWDPEIIGQTLEHGPAPVLPPALDAAAVTRSEATLEAIAELDRVLQLIAADVVDPDWSPAPLDLEELKDRVEQEWREWRHRHGRRATAVTPRAAGPASR